MISNSGLIQMTANANDVQAKSIYHGAKKKRKILFFCPCSDLEL